MYTRRRPTFGSCSWPVERYSWTHRPRQSLAAGRSSRPGKTWQGTRSGHRVAFCVLTLPGPWKASAAGEGRTSCAPLKRHVTDSLDAAGDEMTGQGRPRRSGHSASKLRARSVRRLPAAAARHPRWARTVAPLIHCERAGPAWCPPSLGCLQLDSSPEARESRHADGLGGQPLAGRGQCNR